MSEKRKNRTRGRSATTRQEPRCYFLKRLSKARRASSGRIRSGVVSFSTVTRSSKNVQALRAVLSEMRSGMDSVHS